MITDNVPGKKGAPTFREASRRLAAAASQLYLHGWLLGTGGNLSAVTGENPLRVTISKSGINKGQLDESGFLEINGSGDVINGSGKPSAETQIHLSIINVLGCKSVIHTHSIPSTILSLEHLQDGNLTITGLEMLKGLENVSTHKHIEIIPIIENSQDVLSLSKSVRDILEKNGSLHAILLSGHGLYTWGSTIDDTVRHVEILEFLLEVILRMGSINTRTSGMRIGAIMED
ncbi:MAG: methylthioribulose 1-phosphate dehydratase [Thermoplasmatales archaeon]